MNKKWLLVVALIAGLALFLWVSNKKTEEVSAATVIEPAKAFSDFSLSVSTLGSTFSTQQLENQWTVLFFGYTQCPGICPATMRVMQQVYELLEQKEAGLPQVVLISVDPKRDSAEKLNQYVQSFNSKFLGASGTSAELKTLTQKLGVLYTEMPAHHQHQGNYHMSHTASLFVFNPKGEYQALFSAPHEADKIAKDLIIIQEAYQS